MGSLGGVTSSLLARDDKDRASVKQSAQSSEEVRDCIDDTRNALAAIVQRDLALGHERVTRYAQRDESHRKQFADVVAEAKGENERLDVLFDGVKDSDRQLEVRRQLDGLKAECERVLGPKRELTALLERAVRERDHEFVDMTAENQRKISDMVAQMRQAEEKITQKCAEELQAVTHAYDQERSLHTLQIEKSVKQISAKRQEREVQLLNECEALALQQRGDLEALRQKCSEQYLVMRTEQETKLQAVQREREEAHARYKFSLEELEYNLRVLQENEEEHEEKLKMQQKKLVRQRDCIRSLRRRYEAQDATYRKQNSEITKEYKRIAQSYRELQLRFRNVAYADFNAFREVFNLNERMLHESVLKVLEANRVIMEQQLGKTVPALQPEVLKRWVIAASEFEDLTKTPQAPAEATGAQEPVPSGVLIANKQLSEPLEHLWSLLSDEVGFLVEDRVVPFLGLAPTEDVETSKARIRVDLLLQDLGITQPEDVEQLLSHFLKDAEFGELETPDFVRPSQVLEGLRRFIEAWHQQPSAQQNQATLFAQITADATRNTSSEVARAVLQLQQRMRQQLVEQRKFYQRKGEVVGEDTWRVWNATLAGLGRYVAELEERARLIEDRSSLRQQNAELEALLSQYLDSPANDSLIYAPGDTVDFST